MKGYPAPGENLACLAYEHLRIQAQGARPTFALDMSNEEREIMARHADYWRPWGESGQMVIFGPVLDSSGSWGLSGYDRHGHD